ncbi:MAG: hypothetical protein RL518_2165 [Pseudomonadota bacterium]|jgi:hypothetical protein
MKLARVLLSKSTLVAIVASAALIAFNTLSYNLESEQLASFNDWYPTAATTLESDNAETASKSKLQITIKVEGGLSSSTWSFPTRSMADSDDRAQTSRVLQLIKESKVFGIPQSSRTKDSKVTITVSDESASFATTIDGSDVEDNIQLQNLLKLLEVYAATPKQPINPAQL